MCGVDSGRDLLCYQTVVQETGNRKVEIHLSLVLVN